VIVPPALEALVPLSVAESVTAVPASTEMELPDWPPPDSKVDSEVDSPVDWLTVKLWVGVEVEVV
jgi:hypothetical protein